MSNTGLKRLPLETKGEIIPSILTQSADNNGKKKGQQQLIMCLSGRTLTKGDGE